ncbi:MAG: hypothetical protein ACXWJW_05820 [Xanthobacteraceae bacterium]
MRLSRQFFAAASFGIVAAFAVSSPAAASKCDVQGQIFYMHGNDKSQQTVHTDEHGCDLHFITRKGTRFDSAKIVAKAQNGLLRKIAHVEFRYKPKPGFKGTDKFVLQVCGRTPAGRGCSTLNYDAIVE